MKAKKEQRILLEVPHRNKTCSFELKHAERLLNMGSILNGGWIIPVDSKYCYTRENGIRLKSDKGNIEKAD